MTRRSMDTTPNADDFFKGLGNNFDDFFDLMAEFIDNSVSNIEINKSELDHAHIHITINESEGNLVQVKIEDTGTGIPSSLMEGAFTVGADTGQDSPRNEHGFGMKHAIAAANKTNDNWQVATKTKEDLNNGNWRSISAPFSFSPFEETEGEADWPGYPANNMLPGTVISFSCPRPLFDTLAVRGATSFKTLVMYFRERVGYVYSNVIGDNAIPMKISWKNLRGDSDRSLDIIPVRPDFHTHTDAPDPNPGSVRLDLGGGELEIKYRFGQISESSQHKLCYRVNTRDMGLEIRVDGRLIHERLFEEIWPKKRNPSYNSFRAVVDLISGGNSATIPPTLTNKTGFQKTEMYNKLLRWIREAHPDPPSTYERGTTEGKLRDDLMEAKNRHIPNPKTVSKEIPCFEGLDTGVKVDLFVKYGDTLQLYECKKKKSKLLDLYQLKMYWDGSVRDGRKPTEGILIASEHPEWMENVMDFLNETEDGNGENYNFKTKRWIDEGIAYPSGS